MSVVNPKSGLPSRKRCKSLVSFVKTVTYTNKGYEFHMDKKN